MSRLLVIEHDQDYTSFLSQYSFKKQEEGKGSLILDFGRLEEHLIEEGAYLRVGANSWIYDNLGNIEAILLAG